MDEESINYESVVTLLYPKTINKSSLFLEVFLFFCNVTIDVTPNIYKKSKKSDKILIERKIFIKGVFCYE